MYVVFIQNILLFGSLFDILWLRMKYKMLGEVQHSIAISDRRRWRLHLSPRVGDCQGKQNVLTIILLLSPLITMILFRWGSSRRARWRSWWSPWRATRGSSSPPISTSSWPPIGPLLRPNKCSTYSQKGKHIFWIFGWVNLVCSFLGVCIIDIGTMIGILSSGVFGDLGLTPG